jgi:fluoride exporter
VLTRVLLVAAGGGLGSAARYLLDGAVYRFAPATFPYGTFVVNVLGCLIFGALVGLAEDRLAVGTISRVFVLTGILGGFTTFSTFSFETIELLRDGEWVRGGINVVGQVTGGLVALWAARAATRMI